MIELRPLDSTINDERIDVIDEVVLSDHHLPKAKRLRKLFNKYDTDNDKRLNISELKNKHENGLLNDLPSHFCKKLMKLNDDYNEGYLDCKEFCKLCRTNTEIMKHYCARYCEIVVPPREKGAKLRTLPSDSEDEVDFFMREERISLCPPPLAMITFSLIEIGLFLFDVFYLEEDTESINSIGKTIEGPLAKKLIYNPYRRYEVWRFFTYMFVHIGISHLLSNIFTQLVLGIALEVTHKWWRISIVYLSGVIAGCLASSTITPRVFLAGASGGVFAILAAHISSIILNWNEMLFPVIPLALISLAIAAEFGTSLYNYLNEYTNDVSFLAHLFGAIAGLLIGIGVLRNLRVQSWEKKLWWICITLYMIMILSFVLVHIFKIDLI